MLCNILQGYGWDSEVPGRLGRAARLDGMLTAAAGRIPSSTPSAAQPRCVWFMVWLYDDRSNSRM
jgi:hypothetical protein